MQPTDRKLKKWRKDTPSKHRSFAEKRDRSGKHINEEIRNMLREEHKYGYK